MRDHMRSHRSALRRMATLGLLAALSGLLLGSSQCIWGTDEPFLAGESLAPLEVVTVTPASDASVIPVTVAPAVQWNDRVHPAAFEDGSAWLLQGSTEVPAATRIDLIDCTVALRPLTRLDANTAYTATFDGLRGFGTGPQREPVEVSFTTGDASDPVPPRPTPSFAEIYGAIIGPRCASCHDAYRPPLGLDLSSPEVAETSLRWGALQEDGETPYVVPGQHAASYLMWKVLGLPGITGEAMPPAGEWPSDRACLTPDPGVRALADWIDGIIP